MPFDRYQVAVARATRLLRRNLTPWRSLKEAAQTYRRQCRLVATLVHWLGQHWQEAEAFEESDVTAELLWQLSGELFRMKRQLVLVFAKVSGKDMREIIETLHDAEALNLGIPNPQDNEPQEDED